MREAIPLYEGLVREEPGFVAAWINLGNLLFRLGETAASMGVFARAVASRPENADLRFAFGAALHESGELAAARREYEAALAAEPGFSKAAENLASLLRSLGAIDDAVRWGRRALDLNPESELAAVNLGNALAELGELPAAKEAYRRAAVLRPDDWLARLRVARVCPVVYESREEILAWRAEFERRLDELAEAPRRFEPAALATSGCEPPFALQFHGLDDRTIKRKYARLFEDGFADAGAIRRAGGKPNVGFVVTDGNEPLFVRSMIGVLDRLDPEAFRLTVVCSRRGREVVRRALARGDVEFVELPGRFDLAVEALRAARLDLAYFWEIATDSMNYFLPFARVAPVQCTSWGVQVTSGLPAVAAYVSSRLLEPAEPERHYTERLLLTKSLPSFQRRRVRPARPPDRAEFGLAAHDHVYACVQNVGKFHPDFDAAIEGILSRDCGARIVLAESRQAAANAKLRARFERRLGTEAGRIRFLPPMEVETYHRLLCVSDVMLDPFPFGGVNTTYDGLSFGLPIVTLPGEFQRGRYTFGCLMRMGLEDLAATSLEDYIERAVRWGRDAEERREVQRRILERGDQVFDCPESAAELGDAFLTLLEGC
jgi:predicted O-linked N-acetylglucosamine transferase (SPINDLY family)